MILLFLLVVGAAYFLLKSGGHISYDTDRGGEAERRLKKRYADGEIDEETYLKMLKTIRS